MISIIVPVYKVEKYIHRCVESILNQTYTDFELILSDDGSPDNCGKICDDYALKDSRVHVIHKENGGLSDARNAGIDWVFEHSKSEWIIFIDSDDWIHPRCLELLLEAAEKYGAPVAVGAYEDAVEQTPFESYPNPDIRYIETDTFFADYNTVATVAWGKLYKKEYFQTIRYPFGKLNEDEFVTYRILFQNEKTVFVGNPLYFYFKNTQGIMNSRWSVKKLDALEALENQFNYFKNSAHKRAFAKVLEKYIWFLRENYENLQSCEAFEQKEAYLKKISKNLRKCLKQKEADRPLEKNEGLYAIAYPNLIKLYRLKKRVKKKLKRMTKH